MKKKLHKSNLRENINFLKKTCSINTTGDINELSKLRYQN